ncbi:cysteine desulfurase family protein [Thalassobacillus sp. CUG 92003]|uniref:cysteine desulfurase family protein n=1 Tax=Thalassobacillus sp. CUG 92003 TaxID=2736641 RepID=UPI0015E63EC4|nr:cysteine desulfurase family protein [Thalassobacillus sp. CUG 92003]
MIYLDNSATTKPYDAVLDSFNKVSSTYFANPSSVHRFGGEAERLLRQSKIQAAELMGVEEDEMVFTSGGTEGNNMAIKGIALAHQARGKHIITSQIEHPSVLEACRSLESLGFKVTYLPVDETGRVTVDSVESAIQKDTILISIMSVNNELGSIQPVEQIGELAAHYPKLFFHVDHVQGLYKTPFDIKGAKVDLCTVSGHKVHGLKGTGALYVKRGTQLFPLFHGGNQEADYRAGTENVPGIVAFVKALRLTSHQQQTNRESLIRMKRDLRAALAGINGVHINSPEDGAPHIVNISVPGYKPEVVIHALGEKEIYISTKSACSSKHPDVSAVLAACRFNEERTTSALRISLSYQTEPSEIDTFVTELKATLNELKETMERSS